LRRIAFRGSDAELGDDWIYLLFVTSTAYTCVWPCMLERNTTHFLSGVIVTFGSNL